MAVSSNALRTRTCELGHGRQEGRNGVSALGFATAD